MLLLHRNRIVAQMPLVPDADCPPALDSLVFDVYDFSECSAGGTGWLAFVLGTAYHSKCI